MSNPPLQPSDIIPHKCGVVLSPPAVLYIYENKVNKKLRKLLMPVHSISVNSDIAIFAEDLKMRHTPLLDLVQTETIKKMVYLLVQHKQGVAIEDALLKFEEQYKQKISTKTKHLHDIFKTLDADEEDDLGVDTDFDDLDVPIDKLGIYSDEEGDQFWQ